MSRRLTFGTLASVLALGGLGAAWPALAGPVEQAEAQCAAIKAEFQGLNHQAENLREQETEVLALAIQAKQQAEQVRQMDDFMAVHANLNRAKVMLEEETALRIEEDRGAAVSKRDITIMKLRALIKALEDAELRIKTKSLTDGLVDMRHNELDSMSSKWRRKAGELSAKIADLEAKAKARMRDHADCKVQVERLRVAENARSEAAIEEQQAAPVAFAQPAGPSAFELLGAALGGLIASNNGGSWNNSVTYSPTFQGRSGRRQQGAGASTSQNAGKAMGQRGQRGGKAGGGRGGKGGKNCHANPLTGQQHCGKG